MMRHQLQQYNGAPVDISVDGAEASGILFLSDHNEVYVMSLRYARPGVKCPPVQHVLSQEEIESLTKNGRNRLHSQIEIVSKEAPSRLACTSNAEEENNALWQRVQRANERSRRLKTEFDQLKAEGIATIGRLQDLKKAMGQRRTYTTAERHKATKVPGQTLKT